MPPDCEVERLVRTMRRTYRSLPLWAILPAVAAGIAAAGAPALARGKPLSWKAIDDALLRVNNAAIKDWTVYQTGRKTDPLLLKMGNRFLLIETHDRRLFEIDPSKIENKPDEILWDPSDRPPSPLVTSDWVESDIGGAFEIGAKIDAEDRVLDLQLPHPANVGSLPAHPPASPRQRR